MERKVFRVCIVASETVLYQDVGMKLSAFYLISFFRSVSELLAYSDEIVPDLIIIDVPEDFIKTVEGICVIRLSESHKKTMTIVVSRIMDKRFRMAMTNFGVDDLFQFPFDDNELVARVIARMDKLKLHLEPSPNLVELGNLRFYRDKLSFELDGGYLSVTRTQCKILAALMSRAGSVVTREVLVQCVWENPDIPSRMLDGHVLALKRKLKGFNGYIESAYGIGYRIVLEEADVRSVK